MRQPNITINLNDIVTETQQHSCPYKRNFVKYLQVPIFAPPYQKKIPRQLTLSEWQHGVLELNLATSLTHILPLITFDFK